MAHRGTRDAILDAARHAFAGQGYDGASLRTIAAGAGVDPALVHHYFGTKDQLFLAAMNAPIDPAELTRTIGAVPRDELGRHVVRLILELWDSPAGTAAMGLLRSSMTNAWAARLVREFMTAQILPRVPVDPADAPLRRALAAAQLVGLVAGRHLLRLEPLASAPPAQLIAAYGPGVQRCLLDEHALRNRPRRGASR